MLSMKRKIENIRVMKIYLIFAAKRVASTIKQNYFSWLHSDERISSWSHTILLLSFTYCKNSIK